MLTTSQILNFNGALGTNKLDVWILPKMTSSLGNINKPSGSQFSTIFFKIIADFKNQSRYASEFYDVKGTWWAIYLKKYKTFAYYL